MHPAQALLLDHLYPDPAARLLLLEGGDGRLAQALAARLPAGEVVTLSRDLREVRAAQARLAALPNAAATDEVIPSAAEAYDTVVLTLPKGRSYARALLLAAWHALRPGGDLFIAGPSKEGVKAVITDAERLFGDATVLAYKQHQRVARSTRGPALPEPQPEGFDTPGIAPGTLHLVTLPRPEGILTLETHPGIFSWDALDEGTALLLDHLRVRPGERVWDVGCGAGAIGLSAGLAGAAHVAMTDVNLLAVRCARANVERNALAARVTVRAAEGLEGGEGGWNLIVSNPAFHQGRDVDTSMPDALIARAPAILAPGGRLLLVANRFLAYDKAMRRHFPQVERIAETNKFHVLEARL